jgi:hypothetical protein
MTLWIEDPVIEILYHFCSIPTLQDKKPHFAPTLKYQDLVTNLRKNINKYVQVICPIQWHILSFQSSVQ